MLTKKAIDRLPSLPQVLVQILDAIHSDNADYQQIAQIIRRDIAVAARVIAVANSSYYGRAKNCGTIERALLFLGTETIKTIVITTSIKQYFNHFSQQHHQFLNLFWRKSLIAANFSQVLATLTRYSAPDEAYLCGLLSDVGQLLLLTEDDQRYLSIIDETSTNEELLNAEQNQFSTDHCQLGGDIIDSWEVEGFMGDAVRYHHEPAELVQDAHHLVKIINLANMLSNEGEISDLALASADKLFGLNESLTRELRNQINEDVDKLAHGLGINIGDDLTQEQHQVAHRQLGERLGELSELAQVNADLRQASSEEELQNAIHRALFLTFEVTDSLLFFFDAQNNLLNSQWLIEANNQQATFSIPAEPGRSVVSNTLIHGTKQHCELNTTALTVIDKQLLRHCKSDSLICWPLRDISKNMIVGVLVIGANSEQRERLENRSAMSTTLCSEIAAVITSNHQNIQQIPSADQYQDKIREAVHEVSNPLSIIRNYLETLKLQLGKQHSANEGLELIKDEIDRVGNILLRLNDPNQLEEESSSIMVNPIIEATTKIFDQSICATKNISLTLKLAKNMPAIQGNSAHFKQILTNLLKNAAEAIGEKGEIVVSSDSSVSVSGRSFVAITIEDNGPGINAELKQKLFNPITSNKKNHAGLGLSIIKKLIDDMDGSIMCRSDGESGTQFQILLPR